VKRRIASPGGGFPAFVNDYLPETEGVVRGGEGLGFDRGRLDRKLVHPTKGEKLVGGDQEKWSEKKRKGGSNNNNVGNHHLPLVSGEEIVDCSSVKGPRGVRRKKASGPRSKIGLRGGGATPPGVKPGGGGG